MRYEIRERPVGRSGIGPQNEPEKGSGWIHGKSGASKDKVVSVRRKKPEYLDEDYSDRDGFIKFIKEQIGDPDRIDPYRESQIAAAETADEWLAKKRARNADINRRHDIRMGRAEDPRRRDEVEKQIAVEKNLRAERAFDSAMEEKKAMQGQINFAIEQFDRESAQKEEVKQRVAERMATESKERKAFKKEQTTLKKEKRKILSDLAALGYVNRNGVETLWDENSQQEVEIPEDYRALIEANTSRLAELNTALDEKKIPEGTPAPADIEKAKKAYKSPNELKAAVVAGEIDEDFAERVFNAMQMSQM